MKEIYNYIKENSELPKAILQFTYKDFDNVIQIGRDICVDFSEDEVNIKKMEDIASRPGYMFFNNSKEGIEFFSKNPCKFIFKE